MVVKAYLFPGQGSQCVGMGREEYARHDSIQGRFEQAHEILGFDIMELMFNGPKEELQRTRVAQPAIYLHSVSLAEVLNIDRDALMVAGHSLGEYSALAVAGVLSFEEGLRLVDARAKAMSKACNRQQAMAVILGLENSVVEQICYRLPEVWPVNYNCPGQIVISGISCSVDMALSLAREHKGKGQRLAVEGAFHSTYMTPAVDRLRKAVGLCRFRSPQFPVYQNVDARPYTNPTSIADNLIVQLTSPVLWTETIRQMVTDGATTFHEVGPGKVLSGLVKRIDPSVEVIS